MSGHPDPQIRKIYKTAGNAVELVRDLEPRLTGEELLMLKAASVALMELHARLTKQTPTPFQLIEGDSP